MRSPKSLQVWRVLGAMVADRGDGRHRRGADIHRRSPRGGARRQRRHPRRDRRARQRGHQRRPRCGEQRFRRVQLRRRAARHLYGPRDAHGIQVLREPRPAHRRAAVHHARHSARGRHAAGDHHGHRAVAAHRHVERLDRGGARLGNAESAAVAWPRGLPRRRDGADGDCHRRRAVQPPAGPDQRLTGVAGRGRAARQQLHPRRRPDFRPAQPRRGQPDDRGHRGSQGAGAHLRRRDGPHRRRRVQHGRQIRHQPVPRQRVLPDTAGLGAGEQLLLRARRHPQADRPVLPAVRRRHRRPRSCATAHSSTSPPKAIARSPRATARSSSPPISSAAATSRRPAIATAT